MATVDLEHVHKTYEGGFETVRDFNRVIAHVDATADGAAPAVGETLPIAVDPERAHFFAPGDDGIALA